MAGRTKIGNEHPPGWCAPVERVSEAAMEVVCACGHPRRDHFPAADAMTTGRVCTGRCKLIVCACAAFVSVPERVEPC
jgi:hypothetical protein